jgi:hypothetical protein
MQGIRRGFLMHQSGCHAFVALYVGDTVAQARIVAASSDPELVTLAASRMLAEAELHEDPASPESTREEALKRIRSGSDD